MLCDCKFEKRTVKQVQITVTISKLVDLEPSFKPSLVTTRGILRTLQPVRGRGIDCAVWEVSHILSSGGIPLVLSKALPSLLSGGTTCLA